ncbi:1-acyl-sn-glycerol-3-phosphate acyltransferase, partial [Candidatus Saccharibacteria bacterium]|nr:1-acyl-sn-glycerol-3-phosphate acyltransferase [Candidatus Saccharibacteria bacterium]
RKPVNILAFNMAVAQLLESVTHQYNDLALQFGEWRGVPSVQPRNVEAVAEHYEGHTPDERIISLGQAASSLILRPKVIISDKTTDEILEHTSSGGVLLIVGNHIEGVDPLTYSAVLKQEPAFEHVRHDFIIPAKPIIFRIAGIRYLADGMGSFPTLRKKDVIEEDGTVTEENRKYLSASAMFTTETVVSQLVEGGCAAVLAEGQRNRDNPFEVQVFQKGATFMYDEAVKAGAKVGILPAGIVYGGIGILRPTVHVGGLFVPIGKYSKQKSESVRQEVQRSVDIARHTSYHRR